ncbi:hypothetical protein [Scytonema sp. UIC 10036]|uniref:hypothetical protein n=1 Tax=Scytonema sp. UIC 10036 TaxID=2304196 RepID=UPI001A9B678B|nr:hypothetical protein [Scytonema sp. UIC 10036]
MSDFSTTIVRPVYYRIIERRGNGGSSVLSGLILSKTFLRALCNQLFKHYLS